MSTKRQVTTNVKQAAASPPGQQMLKMQVQQSPMSGLLPPDRSQAPAAERQQSQSQPPPKKVKKTPMSQEDPGAVSATPTKVAASSAPTPARNTPQGAVAQSNHSRSDTPPPETAAKRPRRNASPAPQSGRQLERVPSAPDRAERPERSERGERTAPERSERGERQERSQRERHPERSHRSRPSSDMGFAWVVSEVRQHLEAMMDVDGVRPMLEQLPECVLLGTIAARRELVAALLGEHAHANSAAAALVAPGMRQPIALELRGHPNGTKGLDLANLKGPEADAWLASVSNAASAALGHRLKLDPLRLRLSAVGCANLDIVDLPERGIHGSPIPQKVEEMRTRHLGCTSNLLVCLEPGAPLELARRFDPALGRTVLLGAAAVAAGSTPIGLTTALPPSMLCGPAAARGLEERFMKMCLERAPKWITGMEQLETKLVKNMREAQEMAHSESGIELLSRTRAAGLSFGRALQHVVGGTPCCTTGALTLEEELMDFAAAAASSTCGIGQCLTGKEAAEAVEEVWSSFGGIEGYIKYLRETIGISSADVPLNGGSSWYRLMEEIEVAMRLVHPSAKDLKELQICAVQCGGTGLHGHQRWDDVAAKLLLEIAYEPLRRRIRYVAARVNWALQQQKSAVAEWMAAVEEGPASRLYSPLFAQHLGVLRSSAIARDLVFSAFNKAAINVAETLLKNLEGTLSAMCLNPKIMLRPSTEKMAQEAPCKKVSEPKEVRQRVVAEMRRRSGSSGGGLPAGLRDRTFDPREAKTQLPSVEQGLCRAFKLLAHVLANQAFAFADTSLSALCRRHVDEAMNAIQFSEQQQRALDSREAELQTAATQARDRVEKVRRCLISLKQARVS